MAVERPVEFLNLPRTTIELTVFLPKPPAYFSSFFHSPGKCLFLQVGRASNHEHFSMRDGMCEGICGSERESTGVGGPREEYRQISGGRIIRASWEGGGSVREGGRQMEGLAV